MIKSKFFILCLLLAVTLPFAYGGCGGGGGGDSDNSSRQVFPSKQVLPSGHDFGTVTLRNMPAPLEVKIKNNGSANLEVSDIALSDTDNFNTAILEQMAVDTGGQFYKSDTPDNLKTIYRQLAEILFENQYILDYDSDLGTGVTADLRIEASLSQNILGDDTKEITPCP